MEGVAGFGLAAVSGCHKHKQIQSANYELIK
jgi:hypothetical protein